MKRIVSLLLVLALALSLAGCGSGPVAGFEKQVQAGKHAEALKIYETKIAGNSAYEVEAQDFLEAYLDDAWQDYLAERLDRAGFESILRTLEKLDERLGLLGWALFAVEAAFPEVAASKEAFQQGLTCMKDGDYAGAADCFAQVAPEDELNFGAAQDNYAEARARQQEETLSRARQLADEGRSEDAVALVLEAEKTFGQTPELEAFLQETRTAMTAAAMEEAFARNDDLAVLRIYRDAGEDPYVTLTAGMVDMAAQSKTRYLNGVDSQTEAAFGDAHDYEGALAILRAALAEASDLPEIVAALEERAETYRTYAPVALTSLTPTKKTDYIKVDRVYADTFTDVNGQTHDAGQVICPKGSFLSPHVSKSEDDSYVTYNLNFAYSTFTAALYCPRCMLSGPDTWNTPTTFKIYGDGTLLYEAPAFSGIFYDPIPIVLDVSGVRNLTIVMRGVLKVDPGSTGISDYYPQLCLADGMLQK